MDGSGNITNEYVFFGGKRIAMDTITGSGGGMIGTTYYYAEDFLGSSRAMVQAGQTTPCFDADFLPFGREKDNIATCTQNDYKFEGKERDTETGNDDFGARYYSSNFGRWLSPDWSSTPAPVPYANLTNPQTLNLYAMVQDNPESFADLDGHVNSPQTASQSSICDVTDTVGCNYQQVGWISVIVRNPSEPGSHDITALANKINLLSPAGWPYALTFTPKIAVAQCLKDIAKCQKASDPEEIAREEQRAAAWEKLAADALSMAAIFFPEGEEEAEQLEIEAAARQEAAAAKNVPLRGIHPDSTYESGTAKMDLDSVRKMRTDDIIKSLEPGGKEPLTVKPDGTILDGNTRIKVLQERGVDVNELPRVIYGSPMFILEGPA